MSSFTYDGPRNVLCTPASMSTDVRTQPTPEPTPISDLDSKGVGSMNEPAICRT